MGSLGKQILRLLWPGLIILVCLSGCGSVTTRKGFYDPITAELSAGDYDSAAVMLESARQEGKYDRKDRLVYYLDAGLAYHYAGQYDSSNARLHMAEEAAEELYTKSISRAAASLLLNDNVLEYAGEDYEVLYTNLIKALNYIALDRFDDAFVEIRRANLKLELLEQKYAQAAEMMRTEAEKDTAAVQIDYEADPVRFHNSAMGRYLSMRMYAAEGKEDDARIDYNDLKQAFRTQSFIYNFEFPDVEYETQSGAILSVIALVGLGPIKEGLSLRLRTDKDLDLVQILYDDENRETPEYGHIPMKVSEDYYFKFAIPKLVDRYSDISRVNIYASGEPLGSLQLLEDVGAVAGETFRAKRSLIYLRTVARALAKGLAAHKAKQKADSGGLAGWLKKAAIDVVTDVSENPDLRCARLLPGRIMVGDFEIPPGSYDLTVEFVDAQGSVLGSERFPGYEVKSGGLNLVEAVSLR